MKIKVYNKKSICKRFNFSLLFAGVFIFLFYVVSIVSTLDYMDIKHYVFSDIVMINKLYEFETEKIENDKYLKDLVPIENYSAKIEWNRKKFEIYAYVFENNLQCVQYAENRMQMSFSDNSSFHLSSNTFFTSKYIVYSGNKLLFIKGQDIRSTLEFIDYIQKDFDIKI